MRLLTGGHLGGAGVTCRGSRGNRGRLEGLPRPSRARATAQVTRSSPTKNVAMVEPITPTLSGPTLTVMLQTRGAPTPLCMGQGCSGVCRGVGQC